MRALLLLLPLSACGVVSADSYRACELDLTLQTSAGLPGETVVADGGPLTDAGVRDTRVELGGETAAVVSVTRADACSQCDTCRSEAACAPCGLCDGRILDQARRIECFGDPLASPAVEGLCAGCTESMSFTIPSDAPPGATTVWITNGNGSSAPLPFEVLGQATTTADTGSAR
ncbi:MAG: hypothetical protein H6738_13795 [Alphaproteobacteria bacterium]|nr:hypothetical protein [Alphaproteobacteria bacterium]MCB9697849.1 hypothetical protein [Alphaproteobacteria bacterium]